MKSANLRLGNRQRAVNLLVQVILVTLLILEYGIGRVVPAKLMVWQLIHFSLIALADFYFDDYPKPRWELSAALYLSFVAFMGYSMTIGAFDELFIRLHVTIIIIGSVLGNKIDQTFWKVLSLVYLLVMVGFEVHHQTYSAIGGSLLLYTLISIILVGLAERISEIHRNLWLVHVLVLSLWVVFEGPFYEQSFIYLLAGIPYESTKMLLNRWLQTQPQVDSGPTEAYAVATPAPTPLGATPPKAALDTTAGSDTVAANDEHPTKLIRTIGSERG